MLAITLLCFVVYINTQHFDKGSYCSYLTAMSCHQHSLQKTTTNMVGTPVSPQGHQQFHASVDDFLIATQTYQMEFDVYNPVGRLPACFVREFGSEISDYVILRDPNHNEFEFSVAHHTASNVVFVSIYPQIRVEDYLNVNPIGN
ncbi:DNA helicase [Trifolium repens]|nr:DNA helicase [Trifolium repens]